MRAGALLACLPLLLSSRATAADDPSPSVRVLDLPRYRIMPDAIAGEGPSPAHPLGTVLIAGVRANATQAAIAERDLATGHVVRETRLPLPDALEHLQMARAGGEIHIVADDRPHDEFHYTFDTVRTVVLSSGLQVQTVRILGLGSGEQHVASDGNLVAVLWCGNHEDTLDFGPHLETFNASGHLLAQQRLGDSLASCEDGPSPLVVLGGRVYALTSRDTGTLPTGGTAHALTLTKLSSSAAIEARVDIPHDRYPLWALRGHLFLETSLIPCLQLEERSTLDLQVLATHSFARAAMGQGECPRPDELGQADPTRDPARQSPVEYGFQSQFTVGEDAPRLNARSLFLSGRPAVLEWEETSGAAWISWSAPPGLHPPANAGPSDIWPAVSTPHVLAWPAIESPKVVGGEAPNAAHPRGTVFALQEHPEAPSAPPTVTEWDLATGTRVLDANLPDVLTSCAMVFAGDRIHVVGADGSGLLHHIRLSSSLRAESDDALGPGTLFGLTTDGLKVAVAWSYEVGESSKTHVRIVEGAGPTLGDAMLPGQVSSMAILDGNVFALDLQPEKVDDGFWSWSTSLAKMGAGGGIEKVVPLPPHAVEAFVTATPHRILLIDPKQGSVEERRESDLSKARLLAYPYPGFHYEGCAPLSMARGPGGRWVTTLGDVLGPDLRIERHFATGPVADKALWIGGEAAVVHWGSEKSVSLRWLDP